MKTSRKILVLVLALVMVFACAVPAFAVEWGDSGKILVPSTHPQETGIFHVKLNIQGYSITSGTTSGPIKAFGIDVEMGATGITDSYTVEDVLTAFATQYSSTYQLDMTPDPDHSHYLHAIKDVATNVNYISCAMKDSDNLTVYTGWMFRVNERIPMKTSTQAALIHEAYVEDGDVIDLYYANPYNKDNSTRYTVASYDTEEHKLQALFSNLYVSGNKFEIKNFSPVGLQYIVVYVDGVYNTTTLTDATGHFSLSGSISGTHTIKIEYPYNGYKTYTDLNSSTTTYGVPFYADSYSKVTW